jgi:DNA-binding transcriptional ArsR family regulator
MGAKLSTSSKRYDNRRKIYELLKQEPMTAMEIREYIDLQENNIRNNLRALRAEGKIYISGWNRVVGTSGDWSAIFKAGNRKDVPQPDRREARREASRRHYQNYAALYRMRYHAKRGNLNPFSQLIGASS